VFNHEPEFVRIGTVYLRYIAAGTLFMSTGVVMSRGIQGAGDSISPMVATALALYVVQIPLAYLLPNLWGLNENGIWLATLIGNIINGLLILIVFMEGKWKYKKH
jgi:Na+-driven multidrug efflux pump